ncbi:EthD family reductase [Rubrobacter marinus]|uniref:EthD family reductase n=1 Tax=Rubrobacter marinus TaxID=2653852 RepID=A0A6G8PZX7_9ACTN|nr:EthD family reductase [Rubrobacter marinus]QIN79794.1 EthD family reductase [Rubrobacter marinus]
MVKLTVLYGLPDDPDAFEEYYAESHMPLAARIPNVQRFESGRVAAPDGGTPPYHRIAELWFENASVMQESLSSPEGQAATDDIPNFANGGATVFVSPVES